MSCELGRAVNSTFPPENGCVWGQLSSSSAGGRSWLSAGGVGMHFLLFLHDGSSGLYLRTLLSPQAGDLEDRSSSKPACWQHIASHLTRAWPAADGAGDGAATHSYVSCLCWYRFLRPSADTESWKSSWKTQGLSNRHPSTDISAPQAGKKMLQRAQTTAFQMWLRTINQRIPYFWLLPSIRRCPIHSFRLHRAAVGAEPSVFGPFGSLTCFADLEVTQSEMKGCTGKINAA